MPPRIRRTPLLVILVAISLAALTAFGTKAALSWNAAPAPPAATQGVGRGPLRVARFAIYDAGILPREARVERGRVVLSIKDFTGGAANLAIERDEGEGRGRAEIVRRSGAHWRGRAEMNLAPGTYRLFDPERPEKHATLVVEP
jgi:hypothetical protein